MNKKIGLSSLIFLILCFSAFGIEIEKFNKETVKNDWTDDFPLKNKGSFEMLPHLHQINLLQRQGHAKALYSGFIFSKKFDLE